MVCYLFDTEPLPQPVMNYHQLDPQEHISVQFEKYKNFILQNAFGNVI